MKETAETGCTPANGGMKGQYEKNHRQLVKALAMISQLGITVLTPVVLCTGLGIFLDQKFSTYFTLPLLILGILAGARSAWLLVKRAAEKDDPDEEEERD